LSPNIGMAAKKEGAAPAGRDRKPAMGGGRRKKN
jgi:hypothetical protein